MNHPPSSSRDLPRGIDGANTTHGMVRIRPSNRALGEYLAHYLSAPSMKQRMRARYVGLVMPRINVRDVRELFVGLPPLNEQHEVVDRIKHLFRLADKFQEHIDRASRHIERSQTIFAKAFHGDPLRTP